jgi:hypothetical protein
MHSVKNRFLMRIKNSTGDLYRRYWFPMTTRDVLVAGAAVLWEPSSLPAFWHVARCLPAALRHRRHIMARRRASDEELARWFAFEPVAFPAAEWRVAAARGAGTLCLPKAVMPDSAA